MDNKCSAHFFTIQPVKEGMKPEIFEFQGPHTRHDKIPARGLQRDRISGFVKRKATTDPSEKPTKIQSIGSPAKLTTELTPVRVEEKERQVRPIHGQIPVDRETLLLRESRFLP